LTHAAGLIITSLCYCAHSVLVRGVYLDAEEPGPAAAVLPCYYLRYFFQVFQFFFFQNQVNSKSMTSLQKRQQENATVCDKNGGTDRKQMRDRPPENGWIPEESETMMKDHIEKESTI
jgi:hypothetical protein